MALPTGSCSALKSATRPESDVVYQELQLNAAFDRFDLVTGFRISRRTSTAARERARRITSGAERAVSPRRPPMATASQSASGPNGLFVTVVTGRPAGLAVARGVRERHLAHYRSPESHSRRALRARREGGRRETRFPASDFAPADGLPRTIFAADDWDNTDWRLTLDYRDRRQPHVVSSRRRRLFVPAAYSYNIIAQFEGDAQTALIASVRWSAFTPPERVRNDEIGARTEWLDGRLRVNLTYFDMAYTNRQGRYRSRTLRCRPASASSS